MRIIGVSPASTLQLADGSVAIPGSPAAAVAEKLQPGDSIIKVNGKDVANFVEYRAELAKQTTAPATITLARPESDTQIDVEVGPRFLRRYGLEMELGPIVCLLYTSPSPRDRG